MPRSSTRLATRRKNKKWSPVYVDALGHLDVNPGTTNVGAIPLCTNSVNAQVPPTATVIKCGNFKVWFDHTIATAGATNLYAALYLFFVPQGYTVTPESMSEHPEWIMAWRAFDPVVAENQAISLQSKLKRNLNSGDGLGLVVALRSDHNAPVRLNFNYKVSYVCCSN